MPRPRKQLVCVESTPYYHVMSRCVRRAFLCGEDECSGKSFDHRRLWLEDRVRVLSSLFCVELCAYAIMSNHYHLVVKLLPNEADEWSDDEVFERWTALFRGPLLVQQYQAGKALSAAEHLTLADLASVYRARLQSLSWFMKCLNEPIARQANIEDGCTGHFWESRFISQALRSEKAIFTGMAYVDLNPIRAKMATTPERSEHTSIKARIDGAKEKERLKQAISTLLSDGELRHFRQVIRPLAAFSAENQLAPTKPKQQQSALPMRWPDYLNLADITGRVAVQGKRGTIGETLKPILERLNMTDTDWLSAATAFSKHYRAGEVRLKQAS